MFCSLAGRKWGVQYRLDSGGAGRSVLEICLNFMYQPEGEVVPDTTLSLIWTYPAGTLADGGGEAGTADAAPDATSTDAQASDAAADAGDAALGDAGAGYETCWHNYVVRSTRIQPWRDASF